MEALQLQENNCRLVKELGRGSFGSVWLIQHEEGNLSVMKKISFSNLSHDDRERSKQEVRILSSVKHPNIVSYKGFFKSDDSLCIIMGYCEGGDLHQAIQRQNGCLFPEQRIIRWFIQIVMALLYLHQRNILHRDLKTQNLFLTKSGLIKVGDFGISRHLDSSQDMAETLVGTPFYMSPEILAGVPYNQKSDIWSLGCCLFELVTLRHPFQAKDVCSLVFRITKGRIGRIPQCYSEEVTNLTHSLLHYKPHERPSAMAILRIKFIRNHMETFLSDTKQVERRSVRVSSRSKRRSLNNSREEPEEVVPPKQAATPKRECQIFEEFDSLIISGDKMKLESKTRSEKIETGVRSCNCVRHTKGETKSNFNINSEPRRRRRVSKGCYDEEESSQPSQTYLQDDSLFSPARERRRQERMLVVFPLERCQSPVNETFTSEPFLRSRPESGTDLDKTVDSDLNSTRDSVFVEDFEVDNETYDARSVEEPELTSLDESETVSQELSSFSFCLNKTLLTGKEKPVVTDTCDSPLSLGERMQVLMKDLQGRINDEAMVRVEHILSRGSWDEQKVELENLFGKDAFDGLSSLIWTIKLCQELLS